MPEEPCVLCNTLSGRRVPPGGILYDDSYWAVFLRTQPLLVAGQGFMVLKRHCEHLSELTPAELAALGPMLHQIQCAYNLVLQPAKVHFGMYGEGVKHLDLHITPRLPSMPAGNIPLTLLHVWSRWLVTVHLKRPFPDAIVAEVAEQLRQAFAVASSTTGVTTASSKESSSSNSLNTHSSLSAAEIVNEVPESEA